MRSWPQVYLPPAPHFKSHPKLQLRDSYTNKLAEVIGQRVSSYVCGITPYDATHLGHAATYISFDLIHRFLIASGVQVTFVENITDVDDPLLERAARDDQNWEDLATSQIDLFRSDMTALRILPPDEYQGVIESMPIIISSIESYIKSSLSYTIDSDIYLDLNQVPDFPGNLPFDLERAISIFRERGGDPDRPGKRHPLDPLLWRAKRASEPFWPAPFGAGRPGWHVECVAIALANLPQAGATSISIQGGGSDLLFPHHYMTAIQAKALTGKSFAAHYVHAGMIGLDGEKMSKSKGNLVFVSKLLSENVSPLAIRLALISQHYQSDRMWSAELLVEAQSLITKLEKTLARPEVAPTTDVIFEIVAALANNLDTPRALAAIEAWCDKSLAGEIGGNPGEMSRALDTYLGIAL